MKKFIFGLLMAAVIFTAMPAISAFADDVVYQENPIDKISDWAQTVGKTPEQRDQILAQNKAKRQAKHLEKKAAQMQKKAEKQANEMGKDAEHAGKDMKKKLGLS